MSVEIIKGLNPYNEPEFYRLPGVRRDFSGTTPIIGNGSLTSEVVQVGGYAYFISEIKADQPCTIAMYWYSDSAGANLIDTVSYSYVTAQGLRLISGSVAADYLKIIITNTTATNMTTFWHRLKLSSSPSINLAEVETNQEEQLVALANIRTEINDELLATRNTVESVGEELEVQINLVTTEINDEALAGRTNETSEHNTTRATIESVGEELEVQINLVTAEINDELLATRNTIESVGEELEANVTAEHTLTRTQILAVQTEINDELLATRNTIESVGEELEANITAEHTLTRSTIESVGEELEANITAEQTLTRATIESVGEEIETALTIQHPRIIRTAYDQIGIDAGGRQRVSQLTTLMDGKVVNGHTPLIFESAGTGTQTVGNSKNNMSVTSGQWSIFQTKRFYPYFSGKSQTVECTFDGFSPQADVVKRFGYFSSNAVSPFDATYDGMWCENDGTTIRLRMNRAGTTTLNVPITSWSGYADLGEYQNLANWDNFTVCIFDFLWLGGAVMRFWVKTQSGFVLAHIFNYAGTAPDVFMLEPCKPLRYEIRSSTGSGSFRYICSQIATEGSFEEDGIVRAVTTGTTAIACTAIGTTYPLIAIRKQAAYRCVASRLSDFNIFVSSANDRMLYTVQINPTLSAPLTYADVVNSSVQSAIGNGTITVTTPGIIMATGFLAQNSILPSGLLEHNFLSYMGGTLANVMDEYILCGTPITSGVDTYSSLAYKEY